MTDLFAVPYLVGVPVLATSFAAPSVTTCVTETVLLTPLMFAVAKPTFVGIYVGILAEPVPVA